MDNPVPIFLTIIGVCLVTPILSEWARLPGIVGLIIGGILIGPHGFGLLAVDARIELLATVGLLYLMFSAGLEVDLAQFNRVRKQALGFGILTYLIPQVMGFALGLALGMGWLGALLLGSAFSSHTLIAFPLLVKLGILHNEAMSVTIGATVLTDITAFVVLAGVISAVGGDFSPGYFAGLLGMMVVYALVILGLAPRVGKFFFRHFSGRAVEFQFVLVTLFLAALLAELIGLHAVVGAFLAGLAINATLPHHSPVGERVLFLGESFFIPIFLMYSGMITNPGAFLADTRTIWLAVGVTAVAYISKFAAAWLAGKFYHYTPAETLTVYGLSHAQAAVTIPTLLIGVQLGLFSETLFNAAILMILLTSITSPMLVQRFGRKVNPVDREQPRLALFDRVMVPVANPATQEHLITLASILAHNNNGTLLPLHVAQEGSGITEAVAHQRYLLDRVSAILSDPEADVQLVRRVDSSISKGILRAAIENNATLIVLGWRGRPTLRDSALGHMLDEVVWGTPVPVLVGRITSPINGIQRILLVAPQDRLDSALAGGALEMVATMARVLNVPLLALANPQILPALTRRLEGLHSLPHWRVESLAGNLAAQLKNTATLQDLLVVPTVGPRRRFRSSLGDLPARITSAVPASVVFIHYP